MAKVINVAAKEGCREGGESGLVYMRAKRSLLGFNGIEVVACRSLLRTVATRKTMPEERVCMRLDGVCQIVGAEDVAILDDQVCLVRRP